MDPFSLLGLPPEPWLDPGVLREAFQRRARTLHPDAAEGDAAAFAQLNAAYQTLASPAARLRALAGDTRIGTAPRDVEFAFRVGATLRSVDEAVRAARAASHALASALAAGRLKSAREALATLEAEVDRRRERAEAELRATSAADRPALAALATEFTFLERWTSQVRERALELRLVAG